MLSAFSAGADQDYAVQVIPYRSEATHKNYTFVVVTPQDPSDLFLGNNPVGRWLSWHRYKPAHLLSSEGNRQRKALQKSAKFGKGWFEKKPDSGFTRTEAEIQSRENELANALLQKAHHFTIDHYKEFYADHYRDDPAHKAAILERIEELRTTQDPSHERAARVIVFESNDLTRPVSTLGVGYEDEEGLLPFEHPLVAKGYRPKREYRYAPWRHFDLREKRPKYDFNSAIGSRLEIKAYAKHPAIAEDTFPAMMLALEAFGGAPKAQSLGRDPAIQGQPNDAKISRMLGRDSQGRTIIKWNEYWVASPQAVFHLYRRLGFPEAEELKKFLEKSRAENGTADQEESYFKMDREQWVELMYRLMSKKGFAGFKDAHDGAFRNPTPMNWERFESYFLSSADRARKCFKAALRQASGSL